MLKSVFGGWIGTKAMARMPKAPVDTLGSVRVSSTDGRTDTKGTISKHLI